MEPQHFTTRETQILTYLFPVDTTKILSGLPETTKEQLLNLIFTVIFLSVGKHN